MSSHSKGLLKGAKFNMRHSTVIPDAERWLREVKKLPAVTKIAIGVITPCAPGQRRVKLVPEAHAIRAQVRGVNAIQQFYLYGPDLAQMMTILKLASLDDL